MDEMEQQIMSEMSENLQEQKQSTETIRFQMEKLLQSQKNLETMMSRFFSQTSIPLRPPSQPPDPLDLDKSNLKSDCTFLHEVESIETGSLIQQIEPSDVKDVISTNLILSDGTNPEEESRPEKASTHKADLDFGEETIISNTVPSQVSLYHLPVFDGTLPDCWTMEVDRFFELEQYENEEKLNLISLSVEGAALKWFKRHRREFTDWTDIKRKLMARFGSEKESTDSVEITSIKGHEVQGTTVSHVRQFDVTTIADAVGCCESSLLQHSSVTQSRAPFSPYQSYNDQPYYERKFGECPEIEFDRESDEIKDVKLQDKQAEEDVKTLVISENKQSLECVGDEPFDDEKPGEVIVEEIVDEPVESSAVRGVKSTINDVKFHLKHKWRSRVLPRLSGLEFCLLPAKLDLRDWPKEESKQHKKKSHQVETFEVLSSLEPSRRSYNEQLGVSDDFPFAIVRTHISQSDLKCVTGNAHRRFDVMPLETKPLKNTRKKALQKTWWFKFKTSLERSILMDDKLSFIEESIEKDITKLGAQQGFKIEVWSGFDLEACIGVITYGWEFKKQFKSEKSPFQRTYAAQIKRCEEMARQICFFMDQTSKTRVLAKQMLVKGYDIDLDNVEAGEFFSYAHGSATAPQRGIESQQASEDLLESPWLQGEKCTDSTRENIIWIIFKELCSAGFERENETTKKSFKGLSKVEKDHKIEATVLVFLGHTFGKITSGWIKDQKQGAIYEWSLFLQMLQTVKDRKNTNGVTIQVMVQRQWESFVMMLLTIAESLVLLSDQFIFAENKGIETSISCCYGTSSVDMQFSTSFEIMSKQQHLIQLPNLPWESSHADADGILLKMEVLITPSTQNKAVTKALTQWKEHPPDQFYMALNGRDSIFHS